IELDSAVAVLLTELLVENRDDVPTRRRDRHADKLKVAATKRRAITELEDDDVGFIARRLIEFGHFDDELSRRHHRLASPLGAKDLGAEIHDLGGTIDLTVAVGGHSRGTIVELEQRIVNGLILTSHVTNLSSSGRKR